MPVVTLTVTGTTGPDIDLAAKPITNVTSIKYDFVKKVITIERSDGLTPIELDYAITATVVHTISAGNSTITIT